jgi:hypothetical protein
MPLPHLRRSFADLRDDEVRELVRPALGTLADDARVERPGQGINNRTYVVRARDGSGAVVKMRPRSIAPVDDSPQWPPYTRQLFGPFPNGDLATLPALTLELAAHGSIRPPAILHLDVSLEHVAAPYVVSELLPGRPLGWDDARPPAAGATLGDHVGRVHAATGGAGFGIYSGRGAFRLADWWDRFAAAYRTLAAEVARASAVIAAVDDMFDRALERARATGTPAGSALICVDQSPTHYLGPGDGTISALVDIEGHLFAPAEFELAVLQLWLPETRPLAHAYERHLPWPRALLEQVRPAYWLFTWLEWIYCLRTLAHDDERARALEQGAARLARQIVP